MLLPFVSAGNTHSLLAYETARQRDNAPMMVACDMLKRLFTTDFAPVVLARSLGLNATNALGPIKVLAGLSVRVCQNALFRRFLC